TQGHAGATGAESRADAVAGQIVNMQEDQLQQLIAYVEGQLPPDRRAELEARLATSQTLRQQLETIRQMDRSLTRQFPAPAAVNLDFTAARVRAAVAHSSPEPVKLPWRRWAGLAGLATAASVLVVLAVFVHSEYQKQRANRLTVSRLYDGLVRAGFQPTYVCKDDAEFIDYSNKSFGVPLLARSDAAVTIIGWTYDNPARYKDLGISGEAKIILAKAGEMPVLLLLDRNDVPGPKVDSAARGRLRVFQSNIGGVRIFEITPLTEPLVTRRFTVSHP
ncbi:MAG: hypothetical protein NZ561_03390, partial [Phycisphaerae bacterium]|nr:hypothetical protein [Phycisphaerae bacterium]